MPASRSCAPRPIAAFRAAGSLQTEFDLDNATSVPASERPLARFRIVTPGSFESLGIRVLKGRTFRSSDVTSGAVAVSRSMADRFWPGADPIGRKVRL